MENGDYESLLKVASSAHTNTADGGAILTALLLIAEELRRLRLAFTGTDNPNTPASSA